MRLAIVTGVGIALIVALAAALIFWTRSATPALPPEPVAIAPHLPAPPPVVEPAPPPRSALPPPPQVADAGQAIVAAPVPPPVEPDAGSDGDPLVLDDEQSEEPGKAYPPATEQTVKAELETHAAALRSCYAAWPNPPFSAMRDLSVRLRVRRVPGASGIRIEDVRATVDAPGRVAFEACARRVLAGVRFSKALPEKEITLYLPQ